MTDGKGKTRRILSGVQPSGRLHLGNYFGAIRQHLELQKEPGSEAFYFIANFHALTTVREAAKLRTATRDIALDYLALGLDPKRAVFFRQSDVPEVCELAWILATVTGMGLLQRAHSYKDKVAQGIVPSVGLFTYPILMAADILLPQASVVPVGQDQVQHVEMARDMAGYFNEAFGETFTMPEVRLNPTAKVPGVDGRKMSKSYDNAIAIFETGKPLRQKVMSIKTDSKGVEEVKDPETCHLFAIYRLFLDEKGQDDLAKRYRAGGLAYGHVKQELYECVEEFFAKARSERSRLEGDSAYIDKVLRDGAEKVRVVAEKTMKKVREGCGVT